MSGAETCGEVWRPRFEVLIEMQLTVYLIISELSHSTFFYPTQQGFVNNSDF